LAHPEEAILDRGGYIFYAVSDKQVVGTCALVKIDESTFEVSKMAVTESHKGKGIGKMLLDAAITRAKTKNVQSLILYSNTTLIPAITMYRKFGFREIPKTDFHAKRANIKMALELGSSVRNRSR
jgi:GNAT superfamily N-acetyltransferase